ncbi:2-carboxy-1,4-naphthoquinone phytyltransferase [Waterburya agarophytonicola K14]|uniref:2-carboxy-1,4-naphthoquinone phytyltransferase n=1 Tax=Waterburya agarophytonicola KI4 TaxID=2874699 RepID=A0A964BRW1_9CYAN|nr:2-carboxy-1,4-naphthoquinone phytyltransferase [Waterburya agarophytonicola]MCC0178489.1 2-carboxy-1,4-naphthoquinone phytyltransferase [Waterburya agarophytonicola KI4]
MTTKQISKQDRGLWLAAIKPPIYSVAIAPIAVGTSIAFFETGIFQPQIFLTFLGSAILIIAWLNLSNDVFDSETGIDVNKAHSVVNLTGNKSLVFWIANICLSLGMGGIIALSWWQQDWNVLGLILVCCCLGYTYQGPPFRLGYLGLGEIICFFTFGPGAVSAAYYAQTQQFSGTSLAISSIIGISTSIILFCSHFHQIEDDLAAGKRSPIVRLGTSLGAKVLAIATTSIYIVTLILIVGGALPLLSLIIFGSLPFAYHLVSHVNRYHAIPEKVSNSKFIAVNLYLSSSLLLILGLVLKSYV